MGEPIMNNLRKALLGGAALAVMATGAQADELTALKAQLEALQTKVDSMESSASSYNLPEGVSLLTGRRGVADYNFAYNSPQIDRDWAGGENSGYTIAITPTADMPAPVAEITVSGYVTSWVSLGIDGYSDGEAGNFNPYYWTDTGEAHLNINSRGSIRVRSRIDTAVGQIRTDIELRADAPGNAQMRYAWGEWDMTPNWTLGAGSFWQLNSLIGIPTTINSSGPLGIANTTRRDQVRLTYRDGPLSWAVALEEPTFESNTAMPDITTSIQYDLPGGHQLQFVAGVGDWGAGDGVPAYGQSALGVCTGGSENFATVTEEHCLGGGGTGWTPSVAGVAAVPAQDELGWMIGASAVANLADVATLTVGGAYGEGMVGRNMVYIGGVNGTYDWLGNPREMFGVNAGLGFAINDMTTANVFGGYEEDLESLGSGARAGDAKSGWVVGANIIWQPVRQLRMGWEVNYGEASYYNERGCDQTVDGCIADTEALNFMWQTRFFF
jgi:hypothetical protein